ncbi:hypothetical protein APR41_13965 [Salegentibacter salinarum]|uniref:Uncharacterized protein n=1 Tax=Salegentibacter salinarum TaxID=447422 RepID=A0A2N0U053_9FLAO|nr:hypothetical protein APR41_13965 [Salegentibacter salinarum]
MTRDKFLDTYACHINFIIGDNGNNIFYLRTIYRLLFYLNTAKVQFASDESLKTFKIFESLGKNKFWSFPDHHLISIYTCQFVKNNTDT